MRAILLIILITLAGCAGTQYRSAAVDITGEPDSVLLEHTVRYARLQQSIYADSVKQAELVAIIGELRRRHPDWDWAALEKSKIAVGMTPGEVITAWNDPIHKNTNTVNGRTFEQWVYNRGYGARQYVYFNNGRVSGWGDSGL